MSNSDNLTVLGAVLRLIWMIVGLVFVFGAIHQWNSGEQTKALWYLLWALLLLRS